VRFAECPAPGAFHAAYTTLLLNAFLLTVVLTRVSDPVAARVGLLDLPHGRKAHEQPVPVTGGLAMFGAFVLAMMQLEPSLHTYWVF
jgi:UDP-GlcNAc:undecaprenyl-phosphate GlcNAc-1-phosphate transferase